MGEIYIHNMKADDQKIMNHVEVSEDLKRFIKSPMLFAEYDAEIYADDSILNIPLIAIMLPLAWLSGSNIYVDVLDKTFKESMEELQKFFKNLYPLIPFTTQIVTEKIVDNKIMVEDSDRRTALLFSGGVDSTYSLINNLEKKPRLIMHWGVERTPYPKYAEYWEMVYKIYKDFASKHDLKYNLIKTNALEIQYPRKIEHHFFRELFYGSFWLRLQHSLVLLSLTAPLSVRRFDRLLIAASAHPRDPEINDPYRPHSQIPDADEKIIWADLQVHHYGYIERILKTRALAEYMRKDDLILRVCMEREKAPKTLNCGNCLKCFRTIAQLVQAEVDPNNCGFQVDNSTFDKMREDIIKRRILYHFEQNVQSMIPENIEFDIYGSKAYFEWLRNYRSLEPKDVWFYKDVYDFLPYPLAKILNEVYKLFNIDVHKDCPVIPQKRVSSLGIEEIYPGWENMRRRQIKEARNID